MDCCCHFPSSNPGPIRKLTDNTLEHFKSCLEIWKTSEKQPEKTLTTVMVPVGDCAYIHKTCYSRLTDKNKLSNARKKASTSVDAVEVSGPSETADSEADQPVRKKLRSQSNIKTCSSTKPVLPAICVICNKQNSFFYKKGSGTHRDKLVQAETKDAGQLQRAAERFADHCVSVHFGVGDAVSMEMMYHKRCYKQYIKKGPSTERADADRSRSSYISDGAAEELHPLFCTDIFQKLILSKECYSMTELLALHKTFTNSIQRTSKLKTLLKKQFPELIFDRPYSRRTSELVYVPGVKLADILATSKIDSDDDSDTDIEGFNVNTVDSPHILHHASVLLKSSIDSHDYKAPFPPSAINTTVDQFYAAVPPELFNFIAVITGLVKDVGNFSEYDSSQSDYAIKLLSVCQDIMMLRRKGRNPCPKSMALGIAVKNITGSADLVSLLNSYGHCVSNETLYRAETSIAQKELDKDSMVPAEHLPQKPTTLVYDNIDINEETLTGEGTTHKVNGIIFQNSYITVPTQPITSTPVSKRARHLKAPEKPCLPPFILGKRPGFPVLNESAKLPSVSHSSECLQSSALKEFSYLAVKTQHQLKDTDNSELQLKPGWTGYNKLKCPEEQLLPKSQLYYLDVVEAPPNSLSTVNHLLDRSINIADELKLKSITIVMDQALYSKAQDVRWKNPHLTERIVMRLGEFHTCMSFLGTIGKLFKHSGLEDIMTEANILAGGSVNGVLNGHMYNRSLRVHKVMYEALSRLQLIQFLQSKALEIDDYDDMLSRVETFEVDFELGEQMRKDFTNYVETKAADSPLYRFWDSYLRMVRILLMFIRATRESDWKRHVASLRLMLPFFFALDRQNYARYGSAYWIEMANLEHSHPEVYEANVTDLGCWTVRRSHLQPFTSTAADMAIEQSVNRDVKTTGGLKGFSLNRGAVRRWYITQKERSAITGMCKEIGSASKIRTNSKDLGMSRRRFDEKDVRSVMETVNSFVNPWNYEGGDLVSLVTGVVASPKAKEDLLSVQSLGEDQVREFQADRMRSDAVSFHTSIKRNNLATFCDKKKKVSKAKQQEAVRKHDLSLFGRLLIISQTSREINIRDILSYPLNAVSLPLSSADGSLCKTGKSNLVHAIENDCEDFIRETSKANAIILDAMAVVQSIPNSAIPSTFKQLGDFIFKTIETGVKHHEAVRADFVIDCYYEQSIKNAERERRTSGSASTVVPVLHIQNGEVKIPGNWKAFLSCPANKANLLTYLHNHWATCSSAADFSLYSTTETECIQYDFARNCPPQIVARDELSSDHEEADTRMIAHGLHASQQGHSVLISSPDTDVYILCIAHYHRFHAPLMFLTGRQEKKRVIDIGNVYNQLGSDLCEALIGLHTYTGCDAVSAFSGKGKKIPYRLVKTQPVALQACQSLGRHLPIHHDTVSKCETMTCALYGEADITDINSVRYRAFCTKGSDSARLPPCQQSLLQHTKRANYVAHVWKSAHLPKMNIPKPCGHGWTDQIAIHWFDGPQTSPALLQLTSCGCKKGCTSNCSCRRHSYPCSDLCKCQDCQNISAEIDVEEELCDESDEEDNDY